MNSVSLNMDGMKVYVAQSKNGIMMISSAGVKNLIIEVCVNVIICEIIMHLIVSTVVRHVKMKNI